jgi:hypothetical protein
MGTNLTTEIARVRPLQRSYDSAGSLSSRCDCLEALQYPPRECSKGAHVLVKPSDLNTDPWRKNVGVVQQRSSYAGMPLPRRARHTSRTTHGRTAFQLEEAAVRYQHAPAARTPMFSLSPEILILTPRRKKIVVVQQRSSSYADMSLFRVVLAMR